MKIYKGRLLIEPRQFHLAQPELRSLLVMTNQPDFALLSQTFETISTQIRLMGEMQPLFDRRDFQMLQTEVRQLSDDINRIDARLNGIEVRLNSIYPRLNGMDVRLNGMDVRLNGIDVRLNGIDARLNELFDRMEPNMTSM